MDWIKELTPLVEARGISGDEQQVAQVIRQRLPQGWKAHSDALGNLIVRYGCCAETPAGRRLLMVSAHMDEPGLLVTDIGEKGQVYFTVAGEIDEQVLAGRQVWIAGTHREIPGVIGVKPIHILSAKERETPAKPDKLYVDIGCRSREEALSLVRPGDAVTFEGGITPFGDGLIRGRALDSRSGCAIALMLLQEDALCARMEKAGWELAVVFTAQRESGGAGMMTAAYALAPEISIVLESAPSAFHSAKNSPKLGLGPVLSLRDKASFYDRELYRKAMTIAQGQGLPVQQKTAAFSSSDGVRAQLAGRGSRVLELSVPTRNPRTPCAIQSVKDLDVALQLLTALTQDQELAI